VKKTLIETFVENSGGNMFKNKTTMRTITSYVGLFIVMLFLVSCGKKEVKPVSQESKLAQEAFQVAETLKNAYMKKDRETLQESSTNDGYRDLIESMKNFDVADLTFTPTWVEIKDSSVYLSVSWKGVWTVGTKKTEERGLGIFILEGNPLKLSGIQRENPFRQPE